jgi:hypothetical protein
MTPPCMVRASGPTGIRGSIETRTRPLDGCRAELAVSFKSSRGAGPVEAQVRQDKGHYTLSTEWADRTSLHFGAPRASGPVCRR